jgi:hypothetical protein
MNAPQSSLKPPLRLYALGLLCVVAGAGFSSWVGSMWPLAMGSSVAVICTAHWVACIRAQAAQRRADRQAARKPP